MAENNETWDKLHPDDWDSDFPDTYYDWLPATQFCSYWRGVALSSPHLWAELQASNRPPLSIFIERSRNSPLHLDLRHFHSAFPLYRGSIEEVRYTEIVSCVWDNINRVHSLYIDDKFLECSAYLRHTNPTLSAPNVKFLGISYQSCSELAEDTEVLDELDVEVILGEMPHLHTLKLHQPAGPDALDEEIADRYYYCRPFGENELSLIRRHSKTLTSLSIIGNFSMTEGRQHWETTPPPTLHCRLPSLCYIQLKTALPVLHLFQIPSALPAPTTQFFVSLHGSSPSQHHLATQYVDFISPVLHNDLDIQRLCTSVTMIGLNVELCLTGWQGGKPAFEVACTGYYDDDADLDESPGLKAFDAVSHLRTSLCPQVKPTSLVFAPPKGFFDGWSEYNCRPLDPLGWDNVPVRILTACASWDQLTRIELHGPRILWAFLHLIQGTTYSNIDPGCLIHARDNHTSRQEVAKRCKKCTELARSSWPDLEELHIFGKAIEKPEAAWELVDVLRKWLDRARKVRRAKKLMKLYIKGPLSPKVVVILTALSAEIEQVEIVSIV